jgi:hypothetical protein
MKTNHICSEWLQKPIPYAFWDTGWTGTPVQVLCFLAKNDHFPMARCLHQSLISTDLKDFLYGVYCDQDQQLKHPENAGNSIWKMTAPPYVPHTQNFEIWNPNFWNPNLWNKQNVPLIKTPNNKGPFQSYRY